MKKEIEKTPENLFSIDEAANILSVNKDILRTIVNHMVRKGEMNYNNNTGIEFDVFTVNKKPMLDIKSHIVHRIINLDSESVTLEPVIK